MPVTPQAKCTVPLAGPDSRNAATASSVDKLRSLPMKVGDFVVERLHAWGVRRIYGYPGDGINGVIGALQRADKIEFIQVRHEEMAAFMAVAHAKFTVRSASACQPVGQAQPT
jgi:glyoxylate carboligase